MEANTCKISGLGALSVHEVEDGTSFFFCSHGSSHMQRLFAALLIQKFHKEERQAAKVIAMQVAKKMASSWPELNPSFLSASKEVAPQSSKNRRSGASI